MILRLAIDVKSIERVFTVIRYYSFRRFGVDSLPVTPQFDAIDPYRTRIGGVPHGRFVSPRPPVRRDKRPEAKGTPKSQRDESKRGVGVVAGPGARPYPKVDANPELFVEGFRWQASAWDCEPTQVFNILHELANRHANPSVGLGLDVIHRVFPAALEGPSWSHAIRALGKRLPSNYKVVYALGSTNSRWPNVEAVLAADDCSLPIIAVSSEYWKEVTTGGNEGAGMDHALVVVGRSEDKIVVFDSYIAILARSTYARTGIGKLKISDGLVKIEEVELIRYWEESQVPRYQLWVQRIGRREIQQKLEVEEGRE